MVSLYSRVEKWMTRKVMPVEPSTGGLRRLGVTSAICVDVKALVEDARNAIGKWEMSVYGRDLLLILEFVFT